MDILGYYNKRKVGRYVHVDLEYVCQELPILLVDLVLKYVTDGADTGGS